MVYSFIIILYRQTYRKAIKIRLQNHSLKTINQESQQEKLNKKNLTFDNKNQRHRQPSSVSFTLNH